MPNYEKYDDESVRLELRIQHCVKTHPKPGYQGSYRTAEIVYLWNKAYPNKQPIKVRNCPSCYSRWISDLHGAIKVINPVDPAFAEDQQTRPFIRAGYMLHYFAPDPAGNNHILVTEMVRHDLGDEFELETHRIPGSGSHKIASSRLFYSMSKAQEYLDKFNAGEWKPEEEETEKPEPPQAPPVKEPIKPKVEVIDPPEIKDGPKKEATPPTKKEPEPKDKLIALEPPKDLLPVKSKEGYNIGDEFEVGDNSVTVFGFQKSGKSLYYQVNGEGEFIKKSFKGFAEMVK